MGSTTKHLFINFNKSIDFYVIMCYNIYVNKQRKGYQTMKNITLATIKSIKRNGGATINKYGERVSMKSGYQVSKQDLLIIPVDELSKFTLKELMKLLVKRGEYLGVWIDDGKAYIDISCRVATKSGAMAMGRELKQLSVLRWRDCECLTVV